MQVVVPVSHCKDTHNFDKTNNYFKKVKEKGDQVSDLLCPKLSELLYKQIFFNEDIIARAILFIPLSGYPSPVVLSLKLGCT